MVNITETRKTLVPVVLAILCLERATYVVRIDRRPIDLELRNKTAGVGLQIVGPIKLRPFTFLGEQVGLDIIQVVLQITVIERRGE